jgi:hypothetical protein
MAAVEYASEVFDEMPQELAKHDLDGAEPQGRVSKHVKVHHGNQASAG